MRVKIGMVVVVMGILNASTALAKDKKGEEAGVLTLDETVVRGRIQKPEAFYVLQNADLKYELLKKKRDFLPEIVGAAREKRK